MICLTQNSFEISDTEQVQQLYRESAVVQRSQWALESGSCGAGKRAEMRMEDRKLHWWYRAREQRADQILPNWIYD